MGEHQLMQQSEMVVVTLAGLIGLSLLFWLFSRVGRQSAPAEQAAASFGREVVAVIYLLLVIAILAIVISGR
jgi:succinate dehydrogenase/fumarate reductase cytochrome b subunit